MRSGRATFAWGLLLGVAPLVGASRASLFSLVEVHGGVIDSEGLADVGAVAVSPDGAYVYAAAASGRVVFRREPTTGALTLDHSEPDRPDTIGALLDAGTALSPDGAYRYRGSSASSGRALIFIDRRDPSSGEFVRVAEVGVPRATYSSNVSISSVAVSNDGRSLYAAYADDGNGYGEPGTDDALLVFRRDPASGALEFVEAQEDGVGGFVSLGAFRFTVVSPDGAHVYAGTRGDPEIGVAVFERDLTSGSLHVLQLLPPTVLGYGQIVTSPDGGFLYALASGTLALLRRERASGRATLLEPSITWNEHRDVDGVAVSPDGRNLYATSRNWSELAVFRLTCGDGHLDPGEECDDGNDRDGDGCDAACLAEACFACAGEPSVCAPHDDAPCGGSVACESAGTCHGGACLRGPVTDGASCDDGDACTVGDHCVGGVCVGDAPLTCGSCEACDRRFGCVGALERACLPATNLGDSLVLTAHPGRTVRWRWAGDAATGDGFGDPLESTDYTFCVFDHHAVPRFVRSRRGVEIAAHIPAGARCRRGPCWRAGPDGDFTYRDGKRGGAIHHLSLRPAVPGRKRARIILRGGGKGLRLGYGLPAVPDLTIQLRADTSRCWQADYSARIRINDPFRLAAKIGPSRPCRGRCPGDGG